MHHPLKFLPMRIGIYSKVFKPIDALFLRELFHLLGELAHTLVIYEPFYRDIAAHLLLKNEPATFTDYNDLKGNIDFLFSLGGDGTLLDTMQYIRQSQIPVLGINMGRMGFLSSVGKEEVTSALSALEHGDYSLDKRSLIRIESQPPLFGAVNYALNEFGILKKDTSSMITIHTYVNGNFLNSYWADGLLVATPTGSTAYSLSCGGPIVAPNSKAFVITPVAPHHLTVRPIVLPDDSIITFKVEGRSEHFFCTLDSRYETINKSHQLSLRKETFTFNMVRLKDRHFYATIREKLMWGMDTRN